MDTKQKAIEIIAAVEAKNLATFMPRDEFEGPAYSAIGPDNAERIVQKLQESGFMIVLSN